MDEKQQVEWNEATLDRVQENHQRIGFLLNRMDVCEARISAEKAAFHQIAGTLAAAMAILEEFAPADSARWNTGMRLLQSAGGVALEQGKEKVS